MIIDAASQHRHRIETPDAVGCIASTATMRCDDDVGSPDDINALSTSFPQEDSSEQQPAG